MYASDLGGRVWRFDVRNGQPVQPGHGRRLCVARPRRPGHADQCHRPDNRRFFYAPDVSFCSNRDVQSRQRRHRLRPSRKARSRTRRWSIASTACATTTSLRGWRQPQYKDLCGTTETSPCHQIITDDDTRLVDVTSDMTHDCVPAAAGWKMNLQDGGEKVLAESRTFQNAIYFTTRSSPQLISTRPGDLLVQVRPQPSVRRRRGNRQPGAQLRRRHRRQCQRFRSLEGTEPARHASRRRRSSSSRRQRQCRPTRGSTRFAWSASKTAAADSPTRRCGPTGKSAARTELDGTAGAIRRSTFTRPEGATRCGTRCAA